MSRDDRWTHLIQAASRLAEAQALVLSERRRKRQEILDSAIEVFPPGIEPTEDFEGYAVRRFLLALKESVEEGT